MFVIIPDYISDEIDRRLDAAIVKSPNADKERDLLRSQLVAFFDDHGYVPDFELQARDSS